MRIIKVFTFTAIWLLQAFLPISAQESYPSRPVTLVVGYAPGGPTDTAARIIIQELSKRLGQPVVVENRPGASGMIGERYVQSQPADGYTLTFLGGPSVLNRHLTGLSFDMDNEFVSLGRVYSHHNVLVINPLAQGMAGIKTVANLVSYAKANPNRVNFTSAGSGSIGHLAGQRMANMAEIKLQHISYRGAAPALNDTLGGTVPMIFGDLTTLLPHIRSGRLLPLAVASAQRLAELPSVPTLIEQGFEGLTAVPWVGFAARPGLPTPIARRLVAEMEAVLATPAVNQKMKDVGLIPAFLPPQEWSAQVMRDFDYWGQVIKQNNIRAE